MELILRKDQAKKMIGGVSFELTAQVSLDEEEHALVNRYKAHKWVLHQKKKVGHAERAQSTGGVFVGALMDKAFNNITVGALTSGITFTCKDIAEIIEHEEAIRVVCENFYVALETMKNFGGEEVIKYPEALEEKNKVG